MGIPDPGGPAEGSSVTAGGSAAGGPAAADAGVDDFALDGNAIGGMLMEIFGTEMTTAVGTCAGCGAASQVAELAVYMPRLGTVVRCRNCDAVLMVFTRIHEITCVDLEGLSSLT